MNYIQGLRTCLENKYPDYLVSGSVYLGYMDMTYFSFFPRSFKSRQLKVGIVFNHCLFRFEVWLFGYNKTVQAKYWKAFRESNWKKYQIQPTISGVDSIVEGTLVENPDFSDLDVLTNQIENGTLKFIQDIENFLSEIETGLSQNATVK